jgi:hypothetical protein
MNRREFIAAMGAAAVVPGLGKRDDNDGGFLIHPELAYLFEDVQAMRDRLVAQPSAPRAFIWCGDPDRIPEGI